jgi:hypothetical protein
MHKLNLKVTSDLKKVRKSRLDLDKMVFSAMCLSSSEPILLEYSLNHHNSLESPTGGHSDDGTDLHIRINIGKDKYQCSRFFAGQSPPYSNGEWASKTIAERYLKKLEEVIMNL